MDEEFAEQDNEKLITKELKLGEKKRQENLVRARLVENNGPNSKEGFLSHEYEMKRYEQEQKRKIHPEMMEQDKHTY